MDLRIANGLLAMPAKPLATPLLAKLRHPRGRDAELRRRFSAAVIKCQEFDHAAIAFRQTLAEGWPVDAKCRLVRDRTVRVVGKSVLKGIAQGHSLPFRYATLRGAFR